MRALFYRWLAIFLAVLLAAYLFPNRIVYNDWQSVAVFAAILALLNIFVRPVINFFALPLTCLTFGLFVVVINGFVFWLAAFLYPAVHVGSFADAILGALVVSVVSFVVNRAFD
ncbi:MAG: phage holin family protein [Chloroflexi bacterium]|nr:phage holin family protein [Chloroflexota bacterium]